MFRLLKTLFVLLLMSLMHEQVEAWEYVIRSNVKYVTMAEVRSNYAFTSQRKEGSSWVYEAGSEKRAEAVQLKLRSGSQEMYANGLKFILSYPVIEDPVRGMLVSAMDVTKVIYPLLIPNDIKASKRIDTVILDPGHGGHAHGAKNKLDSEKNLNLAVAKKLKGLLQQKGFKVVMTRETDQYLSLQERVNIANRYDNAVFVSIHFNSGRTSSAGLETFTLAPAGTSSAMSRSVLKTPMAGNINDAANIALASAVQTRMLGYVPKKMQTTMGDRGIKRARFSVLCTIKHPAILVECGFMSNPKEAQLIRTNRYQDCMALAIGDGIGAYRNALNRNGALASSARTPSRSGTGPYVQVASSSTRPSMGSGARVSSGAGTSRVSGSRVQVSSRSGR